MSSEDQGPLEPPHLQGGSQALLCEQARPDPVQPSRNRLSSPRLLRLMFHKLEPVISQLIRVQFVVLLGEAIVCWFK